MGRAYAAVYGQQDPDAQAAQDAAAASAEIDGYLAGRYAVPVASEAALPLLRDWALALAEERAYSRSQAQNDFSEKVKRRADHVRELLKEAAEGRFALAAGLAEAQSGSGVAVVECEEPVFTRGRMTGF